MGQQIDGKALREARARSGLGHHEFAAALGIGKSSLSRYEIGRLPVPRKISLALAGPHAELDAARHAFGGRAA